MIIDGAKTLALARAEVWAALDDIAFLQKTIPECRSLTRTPQGEHHAMMAVGVGPIRANFDVSFTKTIAVPLERFTLTGKGGAGMAGSASGSVAVTLSDLEGGTLLTYSAETEVSGKLAQLGSRMIDGAARKFSEQFFSNVQRELGAARTVPAAGPTAVADRGTVAQAAPVAGSSRWPLYWIVIGCAAGSFLGTFCANLLR